MMLFSSQVKIFVAGGQSETKNGRGGKCKTTAKVAAARETSTRRGATARLFKRAFRPGRMSNATLFFRCSVRLLHKTDIKRHIA